VAYVKIVSHVIHAAIEKNFERLSEYSKVYCISFIQNMYTTSAPFFVCFTLCKVRVCGIL